MSTPLYEAKVRKALALLLEAVSEDQGHHANIEAAGGHRMGAKQRRETSAIATAEYVHDCLLTVACPWNEEQKDLEYYAGTELYPEILRWCKGE